jgi:hypothetical protein
MKGTLCDARPFLDGRLAVAPCCWPPARRWAEPVALTPWCKQISAEVIDAVKADKAIQAGDVGASCAWSTPRSCRTSTSSA